VLRRVGTAAAQRRAALDSSPRRWDAATFGETHEATRPGERAADGSPESGTGCGCGLCTDLPRSAASRLATLRYFRPHWSSFIELAVSTITTMARNKPASRMRNKVRCGRIAPRSLVRTIDNYRTDSYYGRPSQALSQARGRRRMAGANARGPLRRTTVWSAWALQWGRRGPGPAVRRGARVPGVREPEERSA
jgi:hypothetical protein